MATTTSASADRSADEPPSGARKGDRIEELIRAHADEGERDELRQYFIISEELAGAALDFICSIDGEDAGDLDPLQRMREAAMRNGGDVGEQWCALNPCPHHEHGHHDGDGCAVYDGSAVVIRDGEQVVVSQLQQGDTFQDAPNGDSWVIDGDMRRVGDEWHLELDPAGEPAPTAPCVDDLVGILNDDNRET